VKSLFATDAFRGFGPTNLHPQEYVPEVNQVSGRQTSRLRAGIRAAAVRHPGVYGMVDARGNLIYVGKAKYLRSRLLSYFRVKSRDPKAGRIIANTRAIVWEHAPTEFAALVRELELIRRHRPRFNVQGQPGYRRYTYVCLGRTPAPYAYVTREPTGKELGWYGPFVGAVRADEAVRQINDWFGLRDCSQQQRMCFSDQRDPFGLEHTAGCLRYEINTCLGPCAGYCSRAQYSAHVRAARAFLEGKDLRPLRLLAAEMHKAAAECQFERAAALRDRLGDLRWLADRLTWLRTAREQHSFIYPLAAVDGRVIWYLIHRGQVRAAVYEPTSIAARKRTVKLVEAVFRPKSLIGSAPAPEVLIDSVLLVAAWFRKYPEARDCLLAATDALQHCAG
jgi:excinuclease ABC subunit C